MRRDAHGSAGGQAFGCRHRTMNGSGRKRTGAAITLGLAFALHGHSALAQTQDSFPLPRTTFGSIGMVEMPSARMAPDGEIDFSTSFSKNLQRYTLGFQMLPWLEFNFRYSLIHQFHLDPALHQYADRSFGLAIRLAREGEYRPAIAVGIRDLVGTGIYSAEYLAATKRVFNTLDITLGLGWGELSQADPITNPFGYLSHSFRTRSASYGQGGTFNLGTYFHGPNIGVFGGIVWKTPIRHLSLTAEYSSDRYKLESSYGAFVPQYQVNLGAQYQLTDSVQIGAEWLYGESAGITLTFSGNPKVPNFTSTLAPKRIPRSIRTPTQQLNAIRELMKPLSVREQNLQLISGYAAANLEKFTAAVYRARSHVRAVRQVPRNFQAS